MSVRFIFGRAGSGKTRWCLEQIRQALREAPLELARGPRPIFWLLPRQATFQAQRMLACQSPSRGYFRVRVVSFEDLAAEILSECGGGAITQISAAGRRMILGRLLRKHAGQLRFFGQVAHQAGVAGELDATFAELERCDQDAALLADPPAGDAAADLGPALADKLHDLAVLWRAYHEFLGQDRADPARRLARAIESIDRCPFLRGADFYVDSFYEFTSHERRILAALARVGKNLNITLCLDPTNACIDQPDLIPDDLDLWHRSLQTYRALRRGFAQDRLAIAAPLRLESGGRFKSKTLAAMEHWESGQAAAIPASAADLGLIEAPDRRGEVDAAARWIAELVRGGLRYRDIAILVRAEEDYRDLIAASFAEHGIPFFSDRRRAASHHPLLRLVRAALLIARDRWPHDAVMLALKTGLLGLSDAEADRLENFVLEHGIRGSGWTTDRPWFERKDAAKEANDSAANANARGDANTASNPAASNTAAQQAPTIDELRRRVTGPLSNFAQAVAARESLPLGRIAAAVFALLEACGVRATIVRWMDQAAVQGRLEERSEHERVWQELVKLFDEMVQLLGDEPISLADFAAILDSALAEFALALTPPTVDQVLVGPVDRTRTPELRACAILGLDQGQFPRSGRQDTIFNDADRRLLARKNIDLDPDTQRRLLDEEFLGYLAFTRSSEYALATRRAVDDDGRPCAASPFWLRIRERFPALAVSSEPREQDLSLARIATARQLVGSLMRHIRDDAPAGDWLAVYQWLATRPDRSDALAQLARRAFKALTYQNRARLDPELARQLFPTPLNLDVKQLEQFRACPFAHFAGHGLGLSARRDREVDRGDLSRVYHQVLQNLVRQMIQQKRAWADLDDEQIQKQIATLTQQVAADIRASVLLSTARNQYLLGRIEQTLLEVAAAQKSAGARGDFVPALAGVHFGPLRGKADPQQPPLPPLAVQSPGGNRVLVGGRIDRVDVLPDGSAMAIDYHLNEHPLAASMAYHGLSLALLVYLMALEQNGQLLAGRKLKPAAAFAVQLLRKIKTANPEKALDVADPQFHLQIKPRGLFDLRVAPHLDRELGNGWSQVVQIFVGKDGELGHVESIDAANSADFAAVLNLAKHRIGELADRILAGQIDIRPYRLGERTPCAACAFRDLCRFEPAPGAYDDLTPMNKTQWYQKAGQTP